MAIEAIETERLRLRPFQPADERTLLELWNEPEVRRFLWDDRPVTLDTVREQIRASEEAFPAGTGGFFTLSLRETPEQVVGFAGLRRIGESADVELLYALHPDGWGRGLATEASRAVLGWGFRDLGLGEILAGADPPNEASFRVMERLGMRFSHETEIKGRPTRYHRLTREEFLARAGT